MYSKLRIPHFLNNGNKYYKLFYLIIIIFVIMFVIIRYGNQIVGNNEVIEMRYTKTENLDFGETDEYLDVNSKSDIVKRFRACVDDIYDKYSDSTEYVSNYRRCLIDHIPEFNFDKFQMGRFNEYKVFLPLQPNFPQEECNWITVGIGGDSQVEKEFKEKYPRCNVYGVEASPDQYENFADYGTVIPYGVGVVNGSVDLTVRVGTRYQKSNVKVYGMADLLDTFVHTRHIQYMTIDIEGFEYDILEELIPGGKLHEQGIVFCQIDAELHEFEDYRGRVRNFLNLFNNDKSDYIPVFNSQFLTHQKVTFVNIKDAKCREAFDVSKLL